MLFVKGDQCPHSHQAKMYEQDVLLDLFRPQKGQFQMGRLPQLHLYH